MKTIGVVGGGAWGKALYNSFRIKQKDIVIYSRRDLGESYNQVALKDVFKDITIFCIGTQELDKFLEENIKYIGEETYCIFTNKGIDLKTGNFVCDIVAKYLDDERVAYLYGPTFAKEVQEQKPCAFNIFSKNEVFAYKFMEFLPHFMKAYYSDDIIGGSVAGAYKNVIAIASGICDSMKLGENAKAALLTRGLKEMQRFGEYFGAKIETFLGLSGCGDLMLTANSILSRNYRVGYGLGEGKKLEDILQELGEIAEGVETSKAIYKLAENNDIYTPIAREVSSILYGIHTPEESLEKLMSKF